MEQRELAEKFVSNDDIWLFNTGGAQRAYDVFGCRYIPELNMHRFVVWAPHAREVSVVGDFNGWDRPLRPARRDRPRHGQQGLGHRRLRVGGRGLYGRAPGE